MLRKLLSAEEIDVSECFDGRFVKELPSPLQVSGLTPPNMTSKAVAAWKEVSEQRHASWMAEIQSWLTRLRSHEDSVEATASQQIAALVDECLEYRGYPEEQCRCAHGGGGAHGSEYVCSCLRCLLYDELCAML